MAKYLETNGKVDLEKDSSHQTGRTLNLHFRDFLRNDTDSTNRKYIIIIFIIKKNDAYCEMEGVALHY